MIRPDRNDHLLLLSPFFYPEPISTGKYNSHLVQALVRKGIKVDVICFQPLYPDWRPRRTRKRMTGVDISRGGAWLRYPKGNLLRRAVLEIGYFLHVLKHIGRIKHYTRIVAVLPPMLFLPMVRLASGSGCKVIAIVHDLQGIMAGLGVKRGGRHIVRLIRFWEQATLSCCHRVITLSGGMAAFLSENYSIPASKIAVSWPFVMIENAYSRGRLGHILGGSKKHIVYAGALGEKQNPRALISFFDDLVSRRNDVACHVFSSGPIFEDLRRTHGTMNDRLMFHHLVPEQDLYELYTRSHIQVIPEIPRFSVGAVPSKLPNIMASGVPILYIGERTGDVSRIIQKAKAGLCTDSWERETLNMLVHRLLVEGENRSHAERRKIFLEKFAMLFSTEALVGEISG